MFFVAVLSLDAIFSFVSGITLFFLPHTVANLVFSRQTDGVHWHLIRCVGGQILASSVFTWRFRKQSHDTRSTCYVLRLISAVLNVFLLLHSGSVYPGLIAAPMLHALTYLCFGSMAFYALLLMITGWPIGDKLFPENRIGNMLYQLDTIASLAIGMAWIAAPKWLLHRQVIVPMDESHELCARIMGAMFMSSQTISTNALHWRKASDRAVAAEIRTVCCLLILSAQIWSQIAYKSDWSDKHWVGISLFSTWTVIALSYRTYIWWFGGVHEPYSSRCADYQAADADLDMTGRKRLGDTNSIMANGHGHKHNSRMSHCHLDKEKEN